MTLKEELEQCFTSCAACADQPRNNTYCFYCRGRRRVLSERGEEVQGLLVQILQGVFAQEEHGHTLS